MEENQLALLFNISDIEQQSEETLKTKLTKYATLVVVKIFDILGGLVGCMFILPIMFAVIINNLRDKDFGPIFYAQHRIGKNGKLFKMYKFRTMINDADKKLEELLENDERARIEYKKYKKLKNDPRITKFGKFLRKTSLDEFPQFINVLKGEMTLVGPRPYLPREKEDMGEYYNYIIQHKPGITGYWQISGRNDITFEDRMDIDFKYHYKKSLKNDVKILLITLLITARKKGAM